MSKTCFSRSPHESHMESLIPIVHPRWKRTVVTVTDSVKGNASKTTRGQDVDVVPPISCQICSTDDENCNNNNRKNEESVTANYKCPKCSIPYCSVACYQRHGAICTESFYRSRVTQEMDLRQKDHNDNDSTSSSRNQIRHILNRVHEQQQQEHEQQLYEPFQDNDNDDNIISTAELERLQDALDRGQGHDIQLSPELQAAFERDVQAGNLNHIVKPWHPWWRPLFQTNVDANDKDNNNLADDCDDSDAIGIDAMDLDEKILQIPPLSQFIHSPPPDLSFNLVSILYAISQTLMLFGGPVSALCVEAADTIIAMSPVLSHDERYHSLPQVLMALQEQSKHDHNHHQNNSNNYTEDIAQLLSNPRHVAHALLDGIHVLRHVTKSTTTITTTTTLTKEERVQFKKIRKKLEFYLSWSRGGGGRDLKGMAAEIRTWQQDWALLPRDLDLQTLQLS